MSYTDVKSIHCSCGGTPTEAKPTKKDIEKYLPWWENEYEPPNLLVIVCPKCKRRTVVVLNTPDDW